MLGFESSSCVMDSGQILRYARQFEQLIWEIARNPNRRLSEYLLLSDEEKRTLLVEWNSTQTEYEREVTIPELFERQASKTPDAIALEFGNQEITYGDLNRRANVVAGELRKLGVGPEVAVGLGLERSFELVIGMLAILKAGGIYVPLDLTYPRDRLRFIVEEAGIKTVITDRPALFRQVDFPGLHEAQIDSDHLEQSSGGETVASGASPSAQDTAYIMYTSGSTGTPKGTLIPHRAVVRLVRNTNYIEITREDVFLQFAPPTFDASTFEIWASLLNGARLVIHPPGLPSFAELGRLIKSRHISVLWLSAGLFHEMVDHELASLSNVRCLLAGGDTLSVVHVQKANRELTGCQLINGYGPTENTTFSCCYRIPKDWAGAASVPLGRPISNSRAYILDTNKNAVPIGVAGELYVGGDGLSRGYLNRP